MLLMITAISCVVFTIMWYFKNKRMIDVGNQVQGPWAPPIIGYYKLSTLPNDEILSHLTALSKQFKGYFKMWIGTEFWTMVYDPKIVETVLTDQKLLKSIDYDFFKPWLGNGLITNEGKAWFKKRKAITPAFHFNILEDFIDIFVRQGDILISKLESAGVVDVVPLLKLFTFDVICETSMGIEMNAQQNADHEYIKANTDIIDIAYKRLFNPLYGNDIIFWFTKYHKDFHKSLKIVHDVNHKVITNRRNELNKEAEQEVAVDEFGRKKKLALLDMLLKATIDGEPLSDKDIEDEVSTFMFAGHDTTSTALSFLFYSLAKYPDIQEKVAEEVFSVFGEKGDSDITLKGLNQLHYLDLVIKESMRIYTTVPLVGRQIPEELKIDDGTLFPSDTKLTVFVYGMCHDENLFPDPEKFNPERFNVTGNTEKQNPYAYIPFSAGHRNCIGQKFAIYEIKTSVVKILQSFRIELAYPNEELILWENIVLKSKNGINLKFTTR